jgi:hypothetical protein
VSDGPARVPLLLACANRPLARVQYDRVSVARRADDASFTGPLRRGLECTEWTGVTDTDEGLLLLSRHASLLEKRMRDVERAEVEYASVRARTGARGSRAVGLATRRRKRVEEPAFARLADAVGGLCSAWQLFRLGAAAEAFTWQAALALKLPVLFDDGSQSTHTLRQDTVFSYAVVRSDADVLKCFRWRHAKGYC